MDNNRKESRDPLARLAERQNWIAPGAERAVQGAVASAFEVFGENAGKVRSLLHGDWLHEPLHVVLTDVPVGSWTATAVFDTLAAISGSEALNKAADWTLLLGLAGAMGAAITGLNDWSEIKDAAPRRLGAVHGMLNVLCTGLYGWSAMARRKRETRVTARVVALSAYALVSLSAHLGGTMIYEHGIGVEASKRWQDAVPAEGS